MAKARSSHTDFDSVFFEKTRIAIMTILFREKETSFKRLVQLLESTEGRLYSHTGKLEEAGYIKAKKAIVEGKAQTTYSLTHTGTAEYKAYIKFLESFLKESK